MVMAKKFGVFNPTKTEGLLRPITFPSLATLGEMTPDGRWLDPNTAGVRDLPRTIFAQFAMEGDHWGARPVGTLQEVTYEEDGNASGKGWLIDSDDGRYAALLVQTKAQDGNSIDITEARVEWDWDDEIDDIVFKFYDWKLGATTIVAKPAFANAFAELDEITAAYEESDEELVADFASHDIRFVEEEAELTAAAALLEDATIVEWDDFHRPEASLHQKIVVTKDRKVYGHLGLWNRQHMGINGKKVTIPRVRDNYASFNKPGPLSELGPVETGPIFFLGGHPDHPLEPGQTHKAYGGIENAWADVRVINGKLGPWLSGVVRPGMSDETIYSARASRISGHWKGEELQAIVSVNVEGFNVPGSGLSADHDGATFADGKVLELVASFDAPVEEVEPESIEVSVVPKLDVAALGEQIRQALQTELSNVKPTEIHVHTGAIEASAEESETEVDPDAAAAAILIELELESAD